MRLYMKKERLRGQCSCLEKGFVPQSPNSLKKGKHSVIHNFFFLFVCLRHLRNDFDGQDYKGKVSTKKRKKNNRSLDITMEAFSQKVSCKLCSKVHFWMWLNAHFVFWLPQRNHKWNMSSVLTKMSLCGQTTPSLRSDKSKRNWTTGCVLAFIWFTEARTVSVWCQLCCEAEAFW